MNLETLQKLPTRAVREDGAMLKWEEPCTRIWLTLDNMEAHDIYIGGVWYRTRRLFTPT